MPDEIASSRVVLVVGMHRAGTSAVTRTLSLLGASLPSDLLPPLEENPAGFWESESAVALNDDLLASQGLTWSDTAALPDGWLSAPETQACLERLETWLREQTREHECLVVKDPRATRTLSAWLRSSAAVRAPASVLFVVRHPLEVAASLAARDGYSTGHSLLLWLRHYIDGERASRGTRRAFLAYGDLLADWRSTILRVNSDLRLTCLDFDAPKCERVAAFLDRDLRHHRENREQALCDAPWLEQAWAHLLLATRSSSSVLSAAVDSLDTEVASAEWLFRSASRPEGAYAPPRVGPCEPAREPVTSTVRALRAREFEVQRLERLLLSP